MATAWMRQARMRQRAHEQQGERRVFGDARDEARQAYAAWFESLPWDWFATLTIPMGARESGAFIWRCHDRWSARMQQENGRQLRQVAALEYQKRGTAHLHCLTYGARGDADPFHAMHVWEWVAAGGFARIFPYEAAGGAATYCSKYVTKDMELRLVGPWQRYRPEVQLALSSSSGVSTASDRSRS